ncbi:MAG: asparagine synthase (glutamine-hydrolyzing) [Eubacteriales bacterium]|jgi:asparagine synthase (glutamine-hydrolysing)
MAQLKTYRGHIRNWEALASELSIDVSSLSREEREQQILLKAYEKWGHEMGNHLHGMFAFAIWDEKAAELFALRDQFGTKPFYYYETADGHLLYGTYIRDIMDQPGFVKKLNEPMLQYYLTLTYVPGEDTFFEGVKKLMPGHYLVWKSGKISVTCYWAPSFAPDASKSLDDYADEIHSTMLEMMREIKTPDERAESFLSGGVDSSYVFALSDADTANTCGYDNPKFDESPLAKETADYLGRKLSRLKVTPEDYFAVVPFVMYNMEQPLADASAIVFTLGCRAAAQHTKICYSGEGSDEMFGGYNMYRNATRYGDNLPTFYVGNTNIMKEDLKKKILKHYDSSVLPIHLAEPIYKEDEGLDPLSKMQDVDIRLWLEGDIYLNVDKMSTACGLEIRMPITDTRMFDIASRLPAEYKVNETQNKVAFRTAAAKVLPKETAFRKKLGFIVPIRFWLADSRYNSDVVRLFHSDIAAKFFNVDEINAIFDEYTGGNSDLWRQIWTIYTFLVWYEEYFVKR